MTFRPEVSLIKDEFRRLRTAQRLLDPHTDLLSVLSASPYAKLRHTPRDPYGPDYSHTLLNTARIDLAAMAYRELVRMGQNPYVAINAEDEVVEEMSQRAATLGVHEDHLLPLPCGKMGTANTHDNMRVLNELTEKYGISRVTFVTSCESIPRVLRVAEMKLMQDRFIYTALGVTFAEFPLATPAALIYEMQKVIDHSDPDRWEYPIPAILDASRLVAQDEMIHLVNLQGH